ncbi:hypothetical protein RUND412_009560 [Rhizina undulata]
MDIQDEIYDGKGVAAKIDGWRQEYTFDFNSAPTPAATVKIQPSQSLKSPSSNSEDNSRPPSATSNVSDDNTDNNTTGTLSRNAAGFNTRNTTVTVSGAGNGVGIRVVFTARNSVDSGIEITAADTDIRNSISVSAGAPQEDNEREWSKRCKEKMPR